MISILVCSIHPDRVAKLQANVLETIGEPCEFIVHDNRETAYSITRVYNLCAEKAQGDYLCFAHEDICFSTKDWGARIIELLKQPTTGVVGFAGSTMKSATYSGWGALKQHTRYNYVQHFKDREPQVCLSNPDKLSASPVVVLDGMCLFMRKEVWQEFHFDTDTLKGFHLYDLDISIAVGQKYTNYVTNEVLVEHFSDGAYTQGWLDDTLLFHKKWAHRLPVSVTPIEKRDKVEAKISFRFIRMLMKKRVEWSFIEQCYHNHFCRYGYGNISSLRLLLTYRKYKWRWQREGLR